MALKINAATNKTQLAEYAKNELGITLVESMTRDEMIAAIREEEAAQGIEGAAEEGAKTTASASSPKESPVHEDYTDMRAVIVIADLPSHDGGETPPDTHIEVGCNGVFYQLKTGEELDVPYGVYDILNNMRQTKYFSEKDPQTGQQRTSSRVSLRYPFQLLRTYKPQ